MNKKGLSPLASTIILLVISIIIGIIVMTWGRSYVEDITTIEVPVAEDEGIFKDLDDRLRKGEITQEQYNKIKEVLVSQDT